MITVQGIHLWIRKQWTAENALFEWIGNKWMTYHGLQPQGTYWYSYSNTIFEDRYEHRIVVPNLVGYYHQVLRQYWEYHGLGKTCLLVSENKGVKIQMEKKYPGVAFTTTDLFPELMSNEGTDRPDVLWDVCTDPPPELPKSHFESIICQSLLEHVIAPTNAIMNMVLLLAAGGRLYVLTHTPSMVIHKYPRDYNRFHHDYFEDIPSHLNQTASLDITLLELYSKRGTLVACYKKH